MSPLRAIGCCLVLLLAAGCGTEPAAAPKPRRNVVLVLLDTVRADRLSCYGNERETTPAIDALARRGALFRRAQAAAPWTVPSVASLWTGVLPSAHGAGVIADEGEPKAFAGKGSFRGFAERALPTLPQRFRDAGYRTLGFVANPVLDRMSCFLGGFERSHVQFVKAEAAVGTALQWLDELEPGAPFFLYVQLMDAHQPLNPPRQYRNLFPTDGERRTDRQYAEWNGLTGPEDADSPEIAPFRTNKLAVYDGALRYMDDQVARLLADLEARGLAEDTLVVVTSDHGEELWEHAEAETALYDCSARLTVGVGHGQSQFQELLGVPLVIAGPGIEPRVIEAPVSLVDVGATVLELALGDTAPLGTSQSLVPHLRGERVPARAVVSEETSIGHELKAILRPDGLKLVEATDARERDALYDLAADPAELHDLSEQRPADAAALRAELTAIVSAAVASRASVGARGEAGTADLEALGYGGDGEDQAAEPPRKPRRVRPGER